MIFLLACITYEEGMAAQGEFHCQLLEACGELETVGYDNVDDCTVAAQGQKWPVCEKSDYDAEDMQTCVDEWEAAVEAKTCDAAPPACTSVCDREG